MGEFPAFAHFDFDRADIRETNFWEEEAERRSLLRQLEMMYAARIAFIGTADEFRREYSKLEWRLKAIDIVDEYPTRGAKD